jgi:hypothetical protein
MGKSGFFELEEKVHLDDSDEDIKQMTMQTQNVFIAGGYSLQSSRLDSMCHVQQSETQIAVTPKFSSLYDSNER